MKNDKVAFDRLVAEYKEQYLRCNGIPYEKEIYLESGWVRGWSGFGKRLKDFIEAIERFKSRPSMYEKEEQRKANRLLELREEIKELKDRLQMLENMEAELSQNNLIHTT